MRVFASCVYLVLGGALLSITEAKSATGDRVLVLVPKAESSKEYSQVIASLDKRGFDVTLAQATNTSVSLHNYDRRSYDHAILLSPTTKKFGAALTVNDFIRFVDDGGNLIVAVSSELSDFHRKLSAQFGVEFEKRGMLAIDHINNLKEGNASDHTVIASNRFTDIPAVLSPQFVKADADPVYFKGIGHKYDAKSPFLIPLLAGKRTTYSRLESGKSNTAQDDSSLSGSSLGLVSVFQARGNARVAISGSTDIFSNALIKKGGSGNHRFVDDILQWTLQEKAPEHYRINNEIVYEIDLSEYHNNAWHPYSANDVQFEAIMLDPYIRATLNRTQSADTKSTAAYRGNIKLPDRYGTFTFRVNYKRTGLSNIDIKDTVGIWPLRHDEYPRFLSAAYPYYAGSFAMVVGFLALCMAWLWNAEPSKKKNAAKAKSE
ncbi:Dolichyl-diphosphooligosaccharide--protein glycosyltransferase subunit WBP1 [Coemansia spiralis]|nr:Dolichyl-diphosphooligosaccharide--protein glycosyltransferase subunit WBP1 [Coemansia spiralis]